MLLEYIWLIPVLPAIGALLNGIWGKRLPKSLIHWIACSLVFVSFLLSVLCVTELARMDADRRVFEKDFFTWIPGGEATSTFGPNEGKEISLSIPVGFLLDPLSAVMILVVTGVGFLIHLYSVGYMSHEDGYYRFFAYLNLFMFAMLLLVLGNSFLTMFVGWEGVGLCSYLLIGFYYEKKSASDAGKKAFIVNRIGDFGFMMAMITVFAVFGSLKFTEVMAQAPLLFKVGDPLIMLLTLGLFVGAAGKSAQIPLYVWLPDAMEGPTPVSALIHAATMVTAGVYMIARCNVLFSLAPETMLIVVIIGSITALFAASIGLVQKDIKRVLAYSTVSQLGMMFIAMGVGSYAVGIFHLVTHAFFKALLFLGAGSVIHAMSGEQNMMKMGDLRGKIPITFRTMLIATLAIAGIPPLAGFFSKDEILWRAYSSEHGHISFWILAILTASLTAFYMFRLIFLTFFGEGRMDHHTQEHIHESPRSMTVPLMILAVLSIVGGLIGVPEGLGGWSFPFDIYHWLEPVTGAVHGGLPASHALELGFGALALSVAVIGALLAFNVYIRKPGTADRVASSLPRLYNTLYNKYYVDEIYDAVIIQPTKKLCSILSVFDLKVIDGIVNGSAWATVKASIVSIWVDVNIVDFLVNFAGAIVNFFGGLLRRAQTGMVQNYALISMSVFLLFVVVYYLFYTK